MALNDKTKKRIIADWVECQNYSQVARMHGVSDTTVKNIVTADRQSLNKLEQKKEQNTQDILTYLDSKTDSLKRLGDYILDERLDPTKNKDKLDEMSIRDIIQAYGVLTDKMLKSKEIGSKSNHSGHDDSNPDNLIEAIQQGVETVFAEDKE